MEVPLWAAFLALAVALGCIVMVLLTVSLHRFRTGVLVVIVDPTGPLPTLPQADTPSEFDDPQDDPLGSSTLR